MSIEQKINPKNKSKKLPQKEHENLHVGHRERVKNNFIENGFNGFNEHQILELVLFYGYPRIDTNEIAHKLINRFGGLNGVLDANIEDLMKEGKLSKNCAVLLKLFPHIIREYTKNESSERIFNTTQKITDHFEGIYKGETEEKVYISIFDEELRLKKTTLVTNGALAFVPIHIRNLISPILYHNSNHVAIAHNHPNSTSLPSDEDIFLTNSITNLLNTMGINLLDHVVIGTDGAYSMYKNGLFK